MKRLMILAIAAVGATFASCNKSDLQIAETGRPNELPVEVSLSAESLSRPGGSFTASTKTAAKENEGLVVDFGSADTKSTAELTTAEDSKVYNVWAIQYKADGTLLGQPYYTEVTSPAGAGTPGSIDATYDLSVNLTTNTETGGKVYFIANTNSPSTFNATNAATEAALQQVVKNIKPELKPTAAGGVPMLGVYTGAVSSSAAIGSVSMKRLVAKVILKYKVNPAFAGFEVTGVRLKNVPANIYFCNEPTGTFPAKADGSHIDYPAENLSTAGTEGDYKTFVWYMPENLRGVKSGVTDAGDRTLDKTDGCAAYIEIKGTLKSPAKCEKAVYTVLLGDAATNKGDFNVKRNNVYTVTVDIQGTNAADKRISVESFDMNNCGMIKTGETVTFDIRKCLKNTFTSVSDFNTMLANKAWRVEVLWQDVAVANYVGITYNEPGAADDKSLGLFSVKANNATPGNAVVALYDKATQTSGENILWSWHIWVTGYRPNEAGIAARAANTAYPVTGGQVHTYGTKFMTKNPGKVIMDRNLGATKTYYAVPTENDMTAHQAFGMFYEWGRKDPFPHATSTTVEATASTITTIPIYKGTTELSEGTTGCKRVNITDAGVLDGGNTFKYSVKNPLSYIYSTSGIGDWYATAAANQNNALWGDGAAKSAYDPCPKGWRIAPNGTWHDFTRTAENTGTFLWYSQGEQKEVANYLTNGRYYIPADGGAVRTWYPAAGNCNYVSGVPQEIGVYGYSWSSAVDGTYGVFMRANVRLVDFPGNLRAYGRQVRCIQD